METVTETENLMQKDTARKYRQIKCIKCGFIHSSNDRECPECGFSLIRKVLQIAILILLTAGLISSFILLFIRINKLEGRVASLESKASSGSSDSLSEYDITKLSYYSQQLITGSTDLSSLGSDYLIYASQEGCSACKQANEYIYQFLYYGYPDYIPMYFITPDSASGIFFDTLKCENTPTLYRMNKSEIVNYAVGVDDVYNMLDGIISEANS